MTTAQPFAARDPPGTIRSEYRRNALRRVRRCLEDWGYTVQQAGSAAEALEMMVADRRQ